tara:strand:- start:14 stop:196 length:183 start_codon:yes stop_codon:yes gene_type:complete
MKVYQKIYAASFKNDQQVVHMRRETGRKKPVENVKNGDNLTVSKKREFIPLLPRPHWPLS